MTFTIKFRESAAKDLEKLPREDQVKVWHYLNDRLSAASHPQQLGKPLTANKAGLWWYRVHKYRIICQINNQEFLILVIRIAKRDKIYKD